MQDSAYPTLPLFGPAGVAEGIVQTLHEIQAGVPMDVVVRHFFDQARERHWDEFELGFALQVTWISQATQFPAYGSRIHGLHDTVIEEIATRAAMAFPDPETQERITDIITEVLPYTPQIWVQRNGVQDRIAFADLEKALVRSATMDVRLGLLERWGRALAKHADANAMARGSLVARVLDLQQLMRHGAMPAVAHYTAAAHAVAVIAQLTVPQDRELTQALYDAAFRPRVAMRPEPSVKMAAAPSGVEPGGSSPTSRPSP